MSVSIEFYGVARLRTGTSQTHLTARTVGDALAAIARAFPALDGAVIVNGSLHPAYRLSLNAERFVSDPMTLLKDGDHLLLLAADVGG